MSCLYARSWVQLFLNFQYFIFDKYLTDDLFVTAKIKYMSSYPSSMLFSLSLSLSKQIGGYPAKATVGGKFSKAGKNLSAAAARQNL